MGLPVGCRLLLGDQVELKAVWLGAGFSTIQDSLCLSVFIWAMEGTEQGHAALSKGDQSFTIHSKGHVHRGSLGLLCVCVSVPSTACKWEHEVVSEIVCGQQKDNQLSGQAVTKCLCQGCHLCCSHLQTKWCHSWSRSLHFARCYLIFVVHFQRYRCNTDTRELWGLAPSPTSHVEERIAGQGKGRDPWEEVIAALILPGLCSAVVQLFPPTHSQAFPM